MVGAAGIKISLRPQGPGLDPQLCQDLNILCDLLCQQSWLSFLSLEDQ